MAWSWGIATLLTLCLLTSASAASSAAASRRSAVWPRPPAGGVRDAAQPLAQAAGVSPDMIQQQAQAYLQPANPDPATMSPQTPKRRLRLIVTTYAGGGSDALPPRSAVIAIMAAQLQIVPMTLPSGSTTPRRSCRRPAIRRSRPQRMRPMPARPPRQRPRSRPSAVVLLGALAAAFGGSMAVQRRYLISQRTATTGRI